MGVKMKFSSRWKNTEGYVTAKHQGMYVCVSQHNACLSVLKCNICVLLPPICELGLSSVGEYVNECIVHFAVQRHHHVCSVC